MHGRDQIRDTSPQLLDAVAIIKFKRIASTIDCSNMNYHQNWQNWSVWAYLKRLHCLLILKVSNFFLPRNWMLIQVLMMCLTMTMSWWLTSMMRLGWLQTGACDTWIMMIQTWCSAVIPDMLILSRSMSTLARLNMVMIASPSLSRIWSSNTTSSGNLTLRFPGFNLANTDARRDMLTDGYIHIDLNILHCIVSVSQNIILHASEWNIFHHCLMCVCCVRSNWVLSSDMRWWWVQYLVCTTLGHTPPWSQVTPAPQHRVSQCVDIIRQYHHYQWPITAVLRLVISGHRTKLAYGLRSRCDDDGLDWHQCHTSHSSPQLTGNWQYLGII